MIDLTLEDLKQLLLDGRRARQYAWDHYEELAARKHTYTLYGPYASGIGASIPSKLTPKRARILSKKTRRKDFHIYELDDDYKVLRTISVVNYTEIECTYYHFEFEGMIYAYPFRGSTKKMFTDTISALKFSSQKPVFYAEISKNSLFAQFFEYISTEKMLFTEYSYYPNSKYSAYGCPVDPNAPIGAPNSPATKLCTEEVPEYIDFSCWFK